MGLNAYFAYSICGSMGVPWQQGLVAILVSGLLFVLLSTVAFREKLVAAVPNSLKHGIAVGIGLFITLIGAEYGGITRAHPITLISHGQFSSPPVMVALIGLAVTAALMALRLRGAILLGILITAVIGWVARVVPAPESLWGMPEAPFALVGKLDFSVLGSGLTVNFLVVLFVLFYLDLFDTVGTLIGVGEQAGFMKEGKLPRAGRALLADAVGTATGAVLGTSTVTSYIESSTGVAAGARTGLANIVTGILMLLALFFSPIVKMVGGSVPVKEVVDGVEHVTYLYPIIAPALIIVGAMMMKSIVHIDWSDPSEALPAFVTIVFIPFSYNITEGIALGFILYALLKLISGKARQCHWLIYICALAFLARYVLGLDH